MRLTELDIPDRLKTILPIWVTQLLVAIACCLGALVLRVIVDLLALGAGPFAWTMPTVLVATLFARWQSGALTLAISSTYAWYFVLPVHDSFAFAVASDRPRVIANIVAGIFVVVLAEAFRRATRRAIAERELLLTEIDHRVKNNFASVTSMMQLQINRTDDEATRDALAEALGRIESISQAHAFLGTDTGFEDSVDMRPYLQKLCAALDGHIPPERGIVLTCDVDPLSIARDRAMNIGLLVNEIITNSLKHAFEGKPDGTITVRLRNAAHQIVLTVADNGIGMPETHREGALGMRLINALARKERGDIATDTGPQGTSIRISMPV